MTSQRIGKIAGSVAVTAALVLGGAGLAFAQSYGNTTGSSGVTSPSTSGSSGSASSASMTGSSSTTSGGSTTTPGVPNTGAGGDSAGNLAVLGVSALVALGGAAYLARQRYVLR